MSQEQSQQQTAAKVPAKFQEGTVDSILKRVSDFQNTGELVLPANYIPENAVRAAWLMLMETTDRNDKPAIEVCTKESIANAFFEMVTKGLSVVKKQCYFVVYGNKLSLEDSYIGKIAIAKREAGVKEVNAVTIYEGDIFNYENDIETGRKKILEHKQELKNINPDKIVGAYAIVNYIDGTRDCEIMTLPQIHKAWAQGGSKGSSPAHKNFPDQMAEKTVINRALKIEVGSTDDSTLVRDRTSETVNHEIRSNANTKDIDFEDVQIIKEPVVAADLPDKEQSVLEKVGQELASTEEPVSTGRKANF